MPPKKAPNSALVAKLQQQKKEREAQALAQKEARLREEEEERRLREEEARKQAEIEAKKQREKQEIEELKRKGLYKTQKQLQEEERIRQRREELIAAGVVTVRDKSSGHDGSKKTYENKKQNNSNNDDNGAVDPLFAAAEKQRQEMNKVKQEATESFNTNNPELLKNIADAKKNVEQTEQNVAAKKIEVQKLEEELASNEEDIADDWEMEADDDDSDKKQDELSQLKTELSELEEKLSTLQRELKATQKAYNQQYVTYERSQIALYTLKKEEESKAELHPQDKNANATYRAPIVVILGHVDSGKTSLMDKIRNSNVAKGEAGGITQQIGSTFVPANSVIDMCTKLRPKLSENWKKNNPQFQNVPDNELPSEASMLTIEKYNLPGLLCIDTPGHESFSMLRERGGDICDVAILIVDIQQGLQQQTIESIQILKERETPFIIAVTKVDALYSWNKDPENAFNPIQDSLANSKQIVKNEFERQYEKAMVQFAEQEINVKLFWDNPDPDTYTNMVPVSSKTGEGLPDLLNLLVEMTMKRMSARLTRQNVSYNDFRCIVLEVKNQEGQGTTLDVVLANGTINEGDAIICAGLNGPIDSFAKALLVPPNNRDQRVQKEYQQVKSITAAMGFKIIGPDLGRVLAGSSLFVLKNEKYREDIYDKVQQDLSSVIGNLDTDRLGVFLHASSLGSLEALVTLLKKEKIPISGFDIGTVHKASVTMAATQISKQKPEYAAILAFDVKVDPLAIKEADNAGVAIFAEDVVYHLFDKITAHFKTIRESQRAARKPVFPCALKFVDHPNGKHMIFHRTDPILIGCEVVKGSVRIGTPIMMYLPGSALNMTTLGHVMTIKKDGKEDIQEARAGTNVSISIGQGQLVSKPELTDKNTEGEPQFLSKMTSSDADLLKDYFGDELLEEDNKLIDAFRKLKLL